MKKQLIKLTENDLHRIIKESVNNVITENKQYDKGYEMGKRLAQTRIKQYGEYEGRKQIEKIINGNQKLNDESLEMKGSVNPIEKGRLDALIDFLYFN